MATLGLQYPTLADAKAGLDPKGNVAPVAEILHKTNDFWDDVVLVEGNLTTGHQSVQRLTLPTSRATPLTGGSRISKSTKNQIVDPAALFTTSSAVNKRLADIQNDKAAYLLSEATAHLESMNQAAIEAAFLGNYQADPDTINGLAYRTRTLGTQVITGGGSDTDMSSIYLVGWAPNKVYMHYPKNTKVGLQTLDLGEVARVVNDGTYDEVFVDYITNFEWYLGLTVQDPRYVVRIPNIDISALKTTGDATDTSANLQKLMTRAISLLPSLSDCKPVFYMNNTVKTYLELQLENKANMFLQYKDLYQRQGILTYKGVPIRRVDALLETETAIS